MHNKGDGGNARGKLTEEKSPSAGEHIKLIFLSCDNCQRRRSARAKSSNALRATGVAMACAPVTDTLLISSQLSAIITVPLTMSQR